ncbi:AAA family ATPase [Tautonia plasticadhaerens]|uniref:ORC1/DEAH AAA+ ATPase domain-containing protein n=1 Tax=Tautonia plasticadhaerens TaxID=2527974 RepID=A0A518H885_9BACT|nr:AAA family ATPase [Tautonia plasticadhaerens]QDV37063.1 hypothetical protein ElP_49960 [Tautonia plasticadhaerens]
MAMSWLQHWELRFDPFRPGAAPFVAIPGHEEAVRRLVHLVSNGEPRGEIRGEDGIGKSMTLDEAVRRLRRPDRRILSVRRPADGGSVLRGLASALGHRLDHGPGRPELIARLLDSARLARSQNIGLLVAVDDDGLLDLEEDLRLLERVEAIGRQSGCRFTMLVTGRSTPDRVASWPLVIRLDRLTHRESSAYLAEKLRAAGAGRWPFSDRALLRLHALSGGVPAAIDRLSGLALRAGAIDEVPEIPEQLIEGIARECEGPRHAALGRT